jgi:chaperonin GroES
MENDFKFKPLSNYVVVEVSAKKDKKIGSLVVPETAERTVLTSIVVAVSKETDEEGKPFIKTIKVGDHVLFNVYGGQVIDVWGKQYIILRENELFGIIEPEPENLISLLN